MILDSGERRQLGTGVRDMAEGKGRCDLIPLKEIIEVCVANTDYSPLEELAFYQNDRCRYHLANAVASFMKFKEWNISTMVLELAKHYEEGAKKYAENNWKGLPAWCFEDSAIRHYMKWLRDDDDESHDRAFIWNVIGLMYVTRHVEDN